MDMVLPTYARGIARIVALAETSEKHVGMAIVVDDRHVITCCHVLNDALNVVGSEKRDRLELIRPPEGTRFKVRFPYAPKEEADGGVVEWGLKTSPTADVAVLGLGVSVPPWVGVAVFSDAEVWGKKWSCIGWDAVGNDREAQGDLGPILSRSVRQLNGANGVATRIRPGYSGAGVWSDADLRLCRNGGNRRHRDA